MENIKITVLVLRYSRAALCWSKYLEDNTTDLLSFQGKSPKYSIQEA